MRVQFYRIVLFALIAILAISFTSAEEIKKEFDIRTLLTHETDHFVSHRAIPNTNGGGFTIESEPARQIFFAIQNATTTLKSMTYFNNTDTAEVTQIQNFLTTFDDSKNNTGTIEIDGKEYLTFQFTMVNHVAISNGVIKPTGESYQWTIPSHDRWTFTIFNKDGQVKETHVAKKIFVELPKTFWQQYGTYIMMFGLMGANMWVQSKTKNLQQTQAQREGEEVESTEVVTTPTQQKNKKGNNKSKKDENEIEEEYVDGDVTTTETTVETETPTNRPTKSKSKKTD